MRKQLWRNAIKAGSITVYGGELISRSETEAGITSDTVNVYGGTLECEGIYGSGAEGKNITINDGVVIAASSEGAGIGSDSGVGGTCKTVKNITGVRIQAPARLFRMSR